MNKYCDFKNREICFFDSAKLGFPIRGYKADYVWQIDYIPKLEKDLRNKQYNSYCSICQYNPMPLFSLSDSKEHWRGFKQWVQVRDLSIVKVDFFIDFDGKSLKSAFTDALNARNYLLELIGDQALYLNIYFSGNHGFHLLGKMGDSFGKTPQEKLRKNYELAMQLKPLCPSIDETIYDLARVRKLIGSKVYSPTLGQTRVISCDSWQEFENLEVLIAKKDWSNWEKMPIKRLNKIEMEMK
jgi:hypothetical protein